MRKKPQQNQSFQVVYENVTEFEKALLTNQNTPSHVFVLDVHATWCGKCNSVLSTFEKINMDYGDEHQITFGVLDSQKVVAELNEIMKPPVRLGVPIMSARGSSKNLLVLGEDEVLSDEVKAKKLYKEDVKRKNYKALLETFVGLSEPHFLIFKEGELVRKIRGVNTPMIQKLIVQLLTNEPTNDHPEEPKVDKNAEVQLVVEPEKPKEEPVVVEEKKEEIVEQAVIVEEQKTEAISEKTETTTETTNETLLEQSVETKTEVKTETNETKIDETTTETVHAAETETSTEENRDSTETKTETTDIKTDTTVTTDVKTEATTDIKTETTTEVKTEATTDIKTETTTDTKTDTTVTTDVKTETTSDTQVVHEEETKLAKEESVALETVEQSSENHEIITTEKPTEVEAPPRPVEGVVLEEKPVETVAVTEEVESHGDDSQEQESAVVAQTTETKTETTDTTVTTDVKTETTTDVKTTTEVKTETTTDTKTDTTVTTDVKTTTETTTEVIELTGKYKENSGKIWNVASSTSSTFELINEEDGRKASGKYSKDSATGNYNIHITFHNTNGDHDLDSVTPTLSSLPLGNGDVFTRV